MVELVPRLDDGAPDGGDGERADSSDCRIPSTSTLPSQAPGRARRVRGSGWGKAGEGTHTMPWPQRVHSGSPCRPLSGVPSLLAVGLGLRGPLGPSRSPESRSASGMSPVPRSEKETTSGRCGIDPASRTISTATGDRVGVGGAATRGGAGFRTLRPSKRCGDAGALGRITGRQDVGVAKGWGRGGAIQGTRGIDVGRSGARWPESYHPPRPLACPASSGRSLTAWAPKPRVQPAPAASCTPLSPGPLRSHGFAGGLWLCQGWAKEMHQGTRLWYPPSLC